MLTLDVNLKAKNAATQYINFDFNSMVSFNGVQLAAGDDGIHEIGAASTDNGTAITAYFEPIVSNIGTIHPKRMRYLYLGLRAERLLETRITVDESLEQVISIPGTGMLPGRKRMAVSRRLWGSYWRYQIRNVNGSDFSIDSMSGLFLFRNYGTSTGP